MSPRHVAVAALALASLAGCKSIGPSIASAPGPGKTPTAYDADRRGCMAEVDQRLQPVADRANTMATPLAVIAANNIRLQEAYDRGFGDCMAARGEAVAAPGGPADDRLPDGWRLMRVSYHGGAGKPRDENDTLWPREIANPPAGPGGSLAVYTLRFEDGPRSILVSVAGQAEPTCDDGPNGALVTRDYAVCPGKVALVQDGRVTAVRAAGMLCTEAINDGVAPGGPGWKDPARWGTRGRYDPSSGTIDLITMQDGRRQAGCSKQLHAR